MIKAKAEKMNKYFILSALVSKSWEQTFGRNDLPENSTHSFHCKCAVVCIIDQPY